MSNDLHGQAAEGRRMFSQIEEVKRRGEGNKHCSNQIVSSKDRVSQARSSASKHKASMGHTLENQNSIL